MARGHDRSSSVPRHATRRCRAASRDPPGRLGGRVLVKRIQKTRFVLPGASGLGRSVFSVGPLEEQSVALRAIATAVPRALVGPQFAEKCTRGSTQITVGSTPRCKGFRCSSWLRAPGTPHLSGGVSNAFERGRSFSVVLEGLFGEAPGPPSIRHSCSACIADLTTTGSTTAISAASGEPEWLFRLFAFCPLGTARPPGAPRRPNRRSRVGEEKKE